MGKAFAVLVVGTVVATFLVPFHGLTLPSAAETQQKRASMPVSAPVRREKVRSETPKESLSGRDRKVLDRLVSESRTDSR